jgi:hypothetical protein
MSAPLSVSIACDFFSLILTENFSCGGRPDFGVLKKDLYLTYENLLVFPARFVPFSSKKSRRKRPDTKMDTAKLEI